MNHHVHSYAKNCFISWHWTYVFISILVDGFCTGFSNIFISQGPSLCLLFIWNTGINLVKKQFILNTCNMHNCKNSIMHICLRNIFSTMRWIHIQTYKFDYKVWQLWCIVKDHMLFISYPYVLHVVCRPSGYLNHYLRGNWRCIYMQLYGWIYLISKCCLPW